MLTTKPFLVILIFNAVIILFVALINMVSSDWIVYPGIAALVLGIAEFFLGIIVTLAGKSGTLTRNYGIAFLQNCGLFLLLSLALCTSMLS